MDALYLSYDGALDPLGRSQVVPYLEGPAGHGWGFDLVTFKSMLHDWPEEDAGRFLDKAAQALAPSGTLLVFERSGLGAGRPPFSLLPILLFFRSYRGPDGYAARLQALGLQDIRVQHVELDTPFVLLTARKGGG